jgi:hypothetical protein
MSKKTMYIVQEFAWEFNDDSLVIIADTPIKAFPTHAQAEAYRLVQEREARRDKRTYSGSRFPFTFEKLGSDGVQPWTSLSSLPWEEFIERALPFDLPPLQHPNDFYNKEFWEAVDALPEEKHHAFYDLFDGLNFYEVVPIEVVGDN